MSEKHINVRLVHKGGTLWFTESEEIPGLHLARPDRLDLIKDVFDVIHHIMLENGESAVQLNISTAILNEADVSSPRWQASGTREGSVLAETGVKSGASQDEG